MNGRQPNVLLITLDQFRGDCLSAAGHPVVQTPNLDDLAAAGTRLARHYAQAAPCAPGRAALYTGTYQMNNRVVANGTPLDARFDNVALMARRAGYQPTLFGYTDQGIDPRTVEPEDSRMSTYEGVLPGFDVALDMTGMSTPWLAWLAAQGFHFADDYAAMRTEHQRPVELSVSRFITNHAIEYLKKHDEPWFVHLSYLRPHPPFSAAGDYATMYDPATTATPIQPSPLVDRHPLHQALLNDPDCAAPNNPELQRLRSQYFGMISHVDAEIGRLTRHLHTTGEWDSTVIVVTADHGEQLGDHGLCSKLGFFESSYHIVGIIRDPVAASEGHVGIVVDQFTENIDIFPTLCELIGEPVPAQCDGYPITDFLRNRRPPAWRTAAHWEWDWRSTFLETKRFSPPWPWDRRLEKRNLAVLRGTTHAYVSFGDATFVCFDLARDPTWRTITTDPVVLHAQATEMLAWRAQHLDRTMTAMLLIDGGIGRIPGRS